MYSTSLVLNSSAICCVSPAPSSSTGSGVTATDEAEQFVDVGEGDGIANSHFARIQLFDGSGNAVGPIVETKHMISTLS